MIEEQIIKLLDGKYDYDTLEYFDLDSTERDIIARAIINQYFYKMKMDYGYKQFYLEYIEFRLEQLIKEEKYESVDLYERLKKQIKDFITEVEDATCKKLIIYTNLSTYNKLIKGDFKDHEVWICSFQKNTQLPDRQWLFWQHSHSGKLDGVPGLVDFNTFNGDETAWCEYAHEN